MNILHISRTMGQGGAEKVVYQICKESDGENMFIASTGGCLIEQLDSLNLKSIKIPDIDNKNPINILRTFIILFRTVKKYNIQIIHSHHRMAAFYSRIICIFCKKIKRIYTAHNVFFNKKALLRFSLKKSEIVAVGDGVKENLINIYGIEPSKIKIIYNSIEKPKEIVPPKDDFIYNKKNKIFVGSIGRLNEQKGFDVFIKAMSEIIKKDNNVYGIIIGDGELKNEMIMLCKELKIERNIIFLGYRKDVFELIKCMDFIVLASRWEGFPLTPIETFSMKKTIIASNIKGNNEIIIDNNNGLLFEKDNIKELQEKIIYLVKNQSFKQKLEENALKSYLEKYSYRTFIEKYMNLYKETMNR